MRDFNKDRYFQDWLRKQEEEKQLKEERRRKRIIQENRERRQRHQMMMQQQLMTQMAAFSSAVTNASSTEESEEVVTPSIVTDGLIYHIDAGNTESYPGSGPTASSLTGSLSDAILTNGVGFTSDDGGAFTFDGVNDYMYIADNDAFSFGNSSTDSPFSLEVWYNTALGSRPLITKYGGGGREWILLNTADNKPYLVLYSYHSNYIYQYIMKNDGDLSSYANQWINISATYDGRGAPYPYNGMNLYVNGVLQSVDKVSNGTYIAMGNKSQPVQIGVLDTIYANGKISVAKIYNKELSASEVLQNYNALSGRYS